MISKKDGQKESNLEKNNCCNSKKCCKNRGVKKVFSRILWALVFLVFAAFFHRARVHSFARVSEIWACCKQLWHGLVYDWGDIFGINRCDFLDESAVV